MKKRIAFVAEGPNLEILLAVKTAERRSLNKQMQVVLADWIEFQRMTRPEWFAKIVSKQGPS